MFREFVRKEAPETKILAPGSVSESTGDWGVASGGYAAGMQMLPAGDLMAAAGPDVDAFSYHHYGATSQRCAAMGTVVLDSGVPTREGQHVYAHCLRDTPGGVALLVLNTDAREATTLNLGDVAKNGQRYTLTSPELESRTVLLNGHPLALTAKDQLPALGGEALTSDKATFAPISITFVSLPSANNVACARP